MQGYGGSHSSVTSSGSIRYELGVMRFPCNEIASRAIKDVILGKISMGHSWERIRLPIPWGYFSLLRSAIQCIRGARSSRGHAVKLSPVDLVTAEASLQQN